MTTHSEGVGDEVWRRPAEAATPPAAATPPQPESTAGPRQRYPGPPQADRPAPEWRPPVYVQPPPPRRLPPQHLDRVEDEERRARTLTYGIGMVAGAVLLVVMCLLCARVVY